jgi:predicted TPR repeat methyltransferase
LDPANPASRRLFGELLLVSGRLDAAATHLCEALRLAPDDTATRNLLNQLREAARHSGNTALLRRLADHLDH